MRTSTCITQNEVEAYTQFALDNKIITDGDVGVKNADILCNPIINRDSDITPAALSASFAKVRSQLRTKSATYKRADELASKLSPSEQATYKAWAARQRMLIGIDGSEEGYQNVASLLGWMRGNPVTEHNLDLALSNITNNIQFGRIHFKPPTEARAPLRTWWKTEPRIRPGRTEAEGCSGRRSAAKVHGGRKNHAYTPPEDAAKKVASCI